MSRHAQRLVVLLDNIQYLLRQVLVPKGIVAEQRTVIPTYRDHPCARFQCLNKVFPGFLKSSHFI